MEKTSFIKRSPITGRKYDYFSDDTIRLLNFQQAFFYIDDMGIIPLDIVLSDDRKHPGKKVILFLFSRAETQSAYNIWCERKHTIDGEVKVDDGKSNIS